MNPKVNFEVSIELLKRIDKAVVSTGCINRSEIVRRFVNEGLQKLEVDQRGLV